ncbi:hypothetical protein N7495_007116 [Penicillium taxi]|uniref:uncharacterized protein n=1 Tax=Penicillium taxi TaxID=168475 RepID=UPI0025454CCB|nr:uncharacterized protein N7495_007116 [Penicillium taxi]KAJ5895425.1 hypothetical protein N7495_007116 [Penicillium taxi]
MPVPAWQYNVWHGFEAAHIFPLAKETLWNQWGFNRWITNGATGRHINSINSIQNGFLISSMLHDSFDHFHVSVNHDDGYKITTLIPCPLSVDRRIMEPICRDPNNPNRISDNLLRWHIRQAVLVNMRGAGEPSWDSDFPPGRDMMQVIRSGPLPEEQMEIQQAMEEEDSQDETRSMESQQARDDEEDSQDETRSMEETSIMDSEAIDV